MMDIAHFKNLHGRAQLRKAVLILERFEREWSKGDVSTIARRISLPYRPLLRLLLSF